MIGKVLIIATLSCSAIFASDLNLTDEQKALRAENIYRVIGSNIVNPYNSESCFKIKNSQNDEKILKSLVEDLHLSPESSNYGIMTSFCYSIPAAAKAMDLSAKKDCIKVGDYKDMLKKSETPEFSTLMDRVKTDLISVEKEINSSLSCMPTEDRKTGEGK